MSRAGALVISFFLVVLGGAMILQAFGYHALFQNVLGLAREAGPMLGGLVGLSLLGVAHYLADGFGAGGWIAIGIVDLVVIAAIVKHQKEKA